MQHLTDDHIIVTRCVFGIDVLLLGFDIRSVALSIVNPTELEVGETCTKRFPDLTQLPFSLPRHAASLLCFQPTTAHGQCSTWMRIVAM